MRQRHSVTHAVQRGKTETYGTKFLFLASIYRFVCGYILCKLLAEPDIQPFIHKLSTNNHKNNREIVPRTLQHNPNKKITHTKFRADLTASHLPRVAPSMSQIYPSIEYETKSQLQLLVSQTNPRCLWHRLTLVKLHVLLHMLLKDSFHLFLQEIFRNTRTDLTFDHSMDPENKQKNRYVNINACKSLINVSRCPVLDCFKSRK
jgi:hypothetical protein